MSNTKRVTPSVGQRDKDMNIALILTTVNAPYSKQLTALELASVC